uniref:Uncharacterized protein n=1 Tax=Anopheles farauti TaxID=69004 RepID=A0A182QAC3_9DIPT
MSSLIRALSWPLISQSQGGGGGGGGPGGGGAGGPGSPGLDGLDGLGNGAGGHCKKNGGIPPSPTFQQLMAARRLLCRRYYPEGGWGWVVIVVGLLVHTMTHGLQLAYGPLMASVMRYFDKPYTDTGKSETCGRWQVAGTRRWHSKRGQDQARSIDHRAVTYGLMTDRPLMGPSDYSEISTPPTRAQSKSDNGSVWRWPLHSPQLNRILMQRSNANHACV